MNYSYLKELIGDIDSDESRSEVRYGCDCGCGGDLISSEDWDEMVYYGNKAQEKLEKLGIVFD